MNVTCLKSRNVVRIAGIDAESFLQNLLTCEISTLALNQAGFGALLTPQGKILFDFFVHRSEDTFLFDIDARMAEAFIKRLGFYRLRAKVTIALLDGVCVLAGWGDAPLPEGVLAASADPRLAALGWRAIAPLESAPVGQDEAAWHAHRIALFVPQGGLDFAFGDAFPHDVDMDQLNGVSFSKGCYVGQEVVSRMQHRGTARTRMVGASFAGSAPPPGSDIIAGGKTIGHIGSTAEMRLVASVRIDKVLDAQAAGEPITAAGVALTLHKPDWARFDFPGE